MASLQPAPGTALMSRKCHIDPDVFAVSFIVLLIVFAIGLWWR